MKIELEYWKYRPARWLLSDKVRKMKTDAVCGYRFLCDHAMLQELPGVLPFDDEALTDWSRLNAREWQASRKAILENFVQYFDQSGAKTWHHEYIKGLFREYSEQNYHRSTAGKLAVAHRKKKTGNFSVEIHAYTDPYRAYTKFVKKESKYEVLTTDTHAAPPEGASAVSVGQNGVCDSDPLKLGSFLKLGLRKAAP